MKYEMIFGDEKLFDGAGLFTGIDVVTRNVEHGLYALCRLSNLTNDELKANPVVAMRRIISDPKRWTMEDQQAGRLPEVGCRVDGGKIAFVNSFNVVTELESGAVIVSSPKTFLNTFNPIETTEEKAARLREEWKNNVIEIHHGKRRKMSTSTFLLDDIYDALLSGELPMPGKE